MRVVTFANLKGGVGKTTSVHALAYELSKAGKKILCIDDDPQCNLTLASGIDPSDKNMNTLKDVFESVRLGEENIILDDCILHTEQGYDLVPGNLELALADLLYNALPIRAQVIAEAIRTMEKEYDYVLIDTSPSVGLLTQNALFASDDLIVPLNADTWSIQGLMCFASVLKRTSRSFRGMTDKPLSVSGILITMHTGRTNNEKEMVAAISQLADSLHTKLFDTHIRRTVKVREAQGQQLSVDEYDGSSTAAQDYLAFANEFISFEKERGAEQ